MYKIRMFILFCPMLWLPNQPGWSFQKSTVHINADEILKVTIFLKEPSIAQKRLEMRGKGKTYSRKQLATLRKQQDQSQHKLINKLKTQRLIKSSGHQFRYLLNGFSAEIESRYLTALTKHPDVLKIVEDYEVEMHQASDANQSISLINAPAMWASLDSQNRTITGKDVIIAIIDTGVDYNHPDLGGGFGEGFKVAKGYDFINNDPDPMDDNGHGTHVAGIASANGTMQGVAPDATIHAYKTLSRRGVGFSSITAAAIERAVDPDGDPLTDDGAHVINLSLGSRGGIDSPSSQAAEMAASLGVVVVSSAGNRGETGTVGAPANAPSAIAVGSASGSEADSFSTCQSPKNNHLKPEISAPGKDILSTTINASYKRKTGTSMSAPHIAGAVALLRQRFPDWDPSQIKRFLVNSSDYLSADQWFCMGSGLVNLAKATREPGLEPDLAGVWLGKVDPNVDPASIQGSLPVYNYSGQTRLVNIVEKSTAAAQGITLDFSEPVEVQAKSAAQIPFSVRFDTKTVPFSQTRPGFSTAEETFTVDGTEHPFLMLFQKAYTLAFTSANDSRHILLLVPEDDRPRETGLLRNKGTFEFALSPGTYYLSAASSETTDRGESSLWLTTKKITFHENTPSRQIVSDDNRDSFRKLEFSVIDPLGNPLDIDFLEKRAFSLDWNRGDRGFGYSVVGFSNYNVFFSDTTDWSFDYTEYSSLQGRNEYLNFNWHSPLGQNPSTSLEVDLRNHKKIDWIYMGSGFQTMGSLPFLNIRRSGISMGISGSNIINLISTPGPSTARFSTWEPIRSNPAEILPFEHAGRYMSSGSIEGHRFFREETPLFVATNDDQLVSVDMGSNPVVELDSIVTDQVVMGSGPIFPTFTFSVLGNGDNAFWHLFQNLTHVLSDPFGNKLQDPQAKVTLQKPDGTLLTGSTPKQLEEQLDTPIAQGEYLIKSNYANRFRGQPIGASFEQRLNFSGTTLPKLAIKVLRLTRDGKITNVLTGKEVLEIQFEGHPVDVLEVAFDTGNGWVSRPVQATGSQTFKVQTPAPAPGIRTGLRIQASVQEGVSLDLKLPHTFASYFTHQIPWVVDNPQFRSRIALTNTSDTSADVILRATDRQGSVQVRTVTVPPTSVRTWPSADLFDLNGYNIEVASSVKSVKPSYLTLTQRDGAEPSPAQASGVSLDFLSSYLSFGNLENRQISAIVLSAPYQASQPNSKTEVTLTLISDSGEPSTTTVELTGAQPFASTLTQLFPNQNLTDNSWLKAETADETRIVGNVFGFNDSLEPSMSQANNHFRSLGDLVFPWVVVNENWESELSILHHVESFPRQFTVEALAEDGSVYNNILTLEGNDVFTTSVNELFPDLTRYQLILKAGRIHISASLRTVNKQTPSGNSPARVDAVQPADTSTQVVFSYLAGDQVPAIAIVSPWAYGSHNVTLTLLGPNGIVAEKEITLKDFRPYAAVVKDLFPEVTLPTHMAIVAQSQDSQPLAGTSFTFNSRGEPSMAKASPLK